MSIQDSKSKWYIMSRMVIMIPLLGRVRFTHQSDLADKFEQVIHTIT